MSMTIFAQHLGLVFVLVPKKQVGTKSQCIAVSQASRQLRSRAHFADKQLVEHKCHKILRERVSCACKCCWSWFLQQSFGKLI